MTKRLFGRMMSVFSALLLISVIGCSSPVASDFSADFVSKAGSMSSKGKMFFTKDKFRMETPQTITISRMDTKTVWILMPSQKMYMKQAMTEDNTKGVSQKMAGEIKREKVGTETINGIKADKYKVTYNAGGKSNSILQWISSRLSMPVKTSSVDGKWSMELRNIKFGPQSESLFEIPKGYKEFSYNIPSF